MWLENRQDKTENNKPVYFFRGNVTNNKVVFAGKYWRIVRINEDGSVRLILGGSTTTMYGALYRLGANKTPQFMCPQYNDKFTGANAKNIGNKKLESKPIGFLTADEYAYAGGLFGSNSQYNYLYQNAQEAPDSSIWWLGSACIFFGSRAYVFGVNGGDSGALSSYTVLSDYGFRPVISLSSETLVNSGGGTGTYTID